ncbi:TPA: hypothetical protein ACH3X1_005942 [Trebouxia sp. C0004]
MHAYGNMSLAAVRPVADTQGCSHLLCRHFPIQRISSRQSQPLSDVVTRSRLRSSTQASISGNGSYDARPVTADRDGTAGPQMQVPVADRKALSSSKPRPLVTPSVIRSYEVPLWDAMKFNGPGPEIINGRLAMIGILAAAVNESAQAETISQQVPNVPVRIVGLSLLVTYSSLVPILKGAKSEAFGIFTPRAEITNARAAMLGFAILLLLEHKSGVPFF